MTGNASQKLPLYALTALVVSSMIGGGIFSLPQNAAASAGPAAMLIAWSITAVGMLMLALVFQMLANRKPELDSGIYAYARAGFGPYVGFLSAWGYVLSAWIGNISYFVLMFSTLGQWFGAFGEGNTAWAVAGASAILWVIHALMMRGIKQAAIINVAATVTKVAAVALFIMLGLTGFKLGVFTADLWGRATPDLGSPLDQVRKMMLITVWVFIGIEGASVFSARARTRADVGRATVLGFLGTLLLLVLVNVISMGILGQAELAGLENPSMAGVLSQVVGPWGGWAISGALLVSLFGSLLAWMLLCSEILFTAAKDESMPRFLTAENRHGVPHNAVLLSNTVLQIFLLLTMSSQSTYLTLVSLATSTVLLPYLFSALYAVKLTRSGESYAGQAQARRTDLLVAALAVIYSLWLVYAAGPTYLLLSVLAYLPGTALFILSRRERGERVFAPAEQALLAALTLAALYAGYLLYTGAISIGS
ncbi:arginine-ornithine antiporter [Deinococcus lacus]|uniref:Arginine-ornithine antiporter n=1 Tax=Deinococcus lacus TaxID=392561 RepID=A0ABW1YF00_9DEIO